MSIIYRVGQMIMLVMMTLWLLFGAGVSWVAWKAKSDLASSSSEASLASGDETDSDDRLSARERNRQRFEDMIAEMDNERARERDGVRIDTDSARPMVDVDPAHRY